MGNSCLYSVGIDTVNFNSGQSLERQVAVKPCCESHSDFSQKIVYC